MFKKFVKASRLKIKAITKANEQITNTDWTKGWSVPNQSGIVFILCSFIGVTLRVVFSGILPPGAKDVKWHVPLNNELRLLLIKVSSGVKIISFARSGFLGYCKSVLRLSWRSALLDPIKGYLTSRFNLHVGQPIAVYAQGQNRAMSPIRPVVGRRMVW
jgi:hypothetical protein